VCPDVELLAAFADGGLPQEETQRIERHASTCARCAHVLAASATAALEAPGSAVDPPVRSFWPKWRWAVPVATAATVAGLWVVTSGPQIERATAPVSDAGPAATARPTELKAERQETSQPSAVEARRDGEMREEFKRQADSGTAAPARGQGREGSTPAQQRAESEAPEPGVPTAQARLDERDESSRAPASARDADAATSVPPPARAESLEKAAERQLGQTSPFREERRATEAAVVVSSASGNVRWRLQGPRVERSTDAGTTWREDYVAAGPLVGGSAPSAEVVWLYGPGSLIVRRTSSGWTVVQRPARDVETVSIRAASADIATVTLGDGTRFSTADGGKSWSR